MIYLRIFVIINFLALTISQECGRSHFGTPNIAGGEYSEVGQWPWLAPLFFKNGDKFFCGSTLISDRFLLSAAHCIQKKNHVTKQSPDSIYAFLGRYNFDVKTENFAQKAEIESIQIHRDWNYSAVTFDGDIALLKTVTKIIFSDYIIPVCLPTKDASTFNTNGFVAGYGKSEQNAFHETRPKHVRIRSVTQEVCLFSDPVFVRISSPRMFCAGEIAKNPCRGDSGSGWYVRTGNAFKIIGIVSASVSEDCATNAYVIFTNVPKFMEWIEEYVDIRSSSCVRHVKCTVEDDSDGPKCNIAVDLGSEMSCKLVFEDESNPKLDKLNFIGSSMDFVPDVASAISKFKNVNKFDAGWVGIKEVTRRDMIAMKDFTWVSFWGNKLTEIPSNTFADLTKLDKLILGENNLQSIHADTFSTNVKLRELWLQNNQLEVLPRGLFRNNKELSIIYAENNKIATIKVDFLALPKFQLITLGNNVCINKWCEVGDYCGTGSKSAMQQKILIDC